MTERLQFCPWCQSKDIFSVWPESHYDQCRSCSLFFRNPMPTKNELDVLYQDSWSMAEEMTHETGGTDDRLARVYAHRLAKSLGRQDLQGLRILDFGAGRGAMLRALRDLGAEAVGVEPYGITYLHDQGFDAYQDLSDVSGRFDGVVTIDVFEHLHKPWNILRQLYDVLAKDGWIYVATGNPLGLNARLTKGNWREAKKPGHLVWPTPGLMVQMLTWAGFKQVKRLRWFVKYTNNPIRIALHYSLQLTGLDGELRYLAWKPVSGK